MKYETFTVKDYFKNLDLPASVQENLMGRLNLQLDALSEKVKASLAITDEALATCKKRGGKAVPALPSLSSLSTGLLGPGGSLSLFFLLNIINCTSQPPSSLLLLLAL